MGHGGLVGKLILATQTLVPIAGTADTTDVADGAGADAHFAYPRDLAYANGKLYTLDGSVACCASVVRQIDLATNSVSAVASVNTAGPGAPGGFGDRDGVGTTAQIGSGRYLSTDGYSLFIPDTSSTIVDPTLFPTIRQLDLKTDELSTMIGQRGQWTSASGIGTNAFVNAPGPIAYDSKTHVLIFFDQAEGVVQTIQ